MLEKNLEFDAGTLIKIRNFLGSPGIEPEPHDFQSSVTNQVHQEPL